MQPADKTDRTRLLLEINNAVISVLDLRKSLKTISPCLRHIIHHDFAVPVLYDSESRQLRARWIFINANRVFRPGFQTLFTIARVMSGVGFDGAGWKILITTREAFLRS
ncbi:MAG TPA: hypothetical protein VM866_06185 [Pyrinomonadaceae bacterium]|jgi:hypothetical protein|nr:hypothetical protein [Pyrinomonadaceae bacterium]